MIFNRKLVGLHIIYSELIYYNEKSPGLPIINLPKTVNNLIPMILKPKFLRNIPNM